MTVVMETSAVQMLREDVTQFVLNGWTHWPAPMVHTPECFHMKRVTAIATEQGHRLAEVQERFVHTGPPHKPFDVLGALFEAAYPHGAWTPESRLVFCAHCMTRTVEA